jgi:hypothetical protein
MTARALAALASLLVLTLGVVTACAQGGSEAANDYALPQTWLCRPDKATDNACAVDLTTTVVRADGSATVEPFKPDPQAQIDCFYVYPTVSNDPGASSDMVRGPEELGVVKAQFARLGAKCRLYAPMYRQFTLTALRELVSGRPTPGAWRATERAYQDVADAWAYYLAHDNRGRGVVLVGHSQGAILLTQLVAREIDGKPAQARLVSAILMGSRLGVDRGKLTGAFKTIPLCTRRGEVGCVIAFASFRDTLPPPPNSRFGRAPDPGQTAACVNPANLAAGGKAGLHAYLDVGSTASGQWVAGKANPTTPFVSVPGLLSGQCVQKDGFSYLEVHVNADPNDPRTDDILGDVIADGQVNPAWGLHLIDANLVMGDLVDVVGAQARTYVARRGRRPGA